MTEMLLDKLHAMGVIAMGKTLDECVNMSTSAFCRRRLSTVMVYNKFVQRISEAAKLIEQGHVSVGVDVIKDPGMLVTRDMEDLIKWSEGSRVKRRVEEFKGVRDDFEMEGL
jgi:U3 small nucleolar ribonucleoprotein protein IMP3